MSMQSKKPDPGDIEFFKRFSTFTPAAVEQELGQGFYRLGVEEAERRQAKHDIRWVEDALLELLRNSRDAGSTAVAVATSLHENKRREVIVIDNGEGIPPEYHELVFEPRVTSRVRNYIEDEYGVHGRGMALYALRLNADEARVCFSEKYAGTSIRVVFDLSKIPERKNQSERPRLVKTDEGYELKGQKNIFYTVVDFYLKHQKVDLFLGSPAEVLRLVWESPSFKVLKEKAAGTDNSVAGLLSLAEKLGLGVSARTAYRILNREIQMPFHARNFFPSMRFSKSAGLPLKFNSEDWQVLSGSLKQVLEPFLKRYNYQVIEIRQAKRKGQLKVEVLLEPSEEEE